MKTNLHLSKKEKFGYFYIEGKKLEILALNSSETVELELHNFSFWWSSFDLCVTQVHRGKLKFRERVLKLKVLFVIAYWVLCVRTSDCQGQGHKFMVKVTKVIRLKSSW